MKTRGIRRSRWSLRLTEANSLARGSRKIFPNSWSLARHSWRSPQMKCIHKHRTRPLRARSTSRMQCLIVILNLYEYLRGFTIIKYTMKRFPQKQCHHKSCYHLLLTIICLRRSSKLKRKHRITNSKQSTHKIIHTIVKQLLQWKLTYQMLKKIPMIMQSSKDGRKIKNLITHLTNPEVYFIRVSNITPLKIK